MKENSIVVVIPFELSEEEKLLNLQWLPERDGKTLYTVRKIVRDGKGILFEEGVIGFIGGREISIHINKVKEILPPEDISFLLETKTEEPCLT